MERIRIENFAGIKEMDFEIKSINLFIGPQGSGKSITVKLLYFFKKFFKNIIINTIEKRSKAEMDRKQKEMFLNFFPKDSWSKEDFRIEYEISSISVVVEFKQSKLKFVYSDKLKDTIKKAQKVYLNEKRKIDGNVDVNSQSLNRDLTKLLQKCLSSEISKLSIYDQFFIPAGRSFFAHIQGNIFYLLSENKSLDPFLIEFGAFYDDLRTRYWNTITKVETQVFDENSSKILYSSHHREKDKDFLIHNNQRKVNLSNASSGQQEILPLIVVLKALNSLNFPSGGVTVFIEEPEAHLFPNAQKQIVQLIARTFNNEKTNFQFFITTHSPYILASFNNLMQAGKLALEKPEEIDRINKIIPTNEHINPELVTAYSLKNGVMQSLIDDESKLISQTLLDDVSNEISDEFSQLLDIEF